MSTDASAPAHSSPYRSFWQAGFEGADHVNGFGLPLDMNRATRHLENIDEDYARLARFDMRTVRESVGWRCCERGPGFDFASVRRRAEAAQRHGVQILWTCLHYGVPADIDLFSKEFVARFARFCEALALCLRPWSGGDLAPVFTPVNEISFFGWAVCETGLMHPFRGDMPERGYELKKNLVAAALAGGDAIRSVMPEARLLHVDPLVHIVAPRDRPDLAEAAARRSAFQFQAWDMLCGRIEPELGGSPAQLDLIGVNYYPNNQWEHLTDARLHWHLRDPRRRTFADLLAETARRYGRPLVVAETSHQGAAKAQWISEIAEDVDKARRSGVDVQGICLYPATDRPDWQDPLRWHTSGLWSVDPNHADLPRSLDETYARALRHAQCRLAHQPLKEQETPMKTLVVFSHLRWDFVFQRPQHLLSRLARTRRILFVEEPVHDDTDPVAEILDPAPGVRVLRPHTRVRAPGFHDEQIGAISRLLAERLAIDAPDGYSVWFYTPMALPLLGGLEPEAIVYDCMDELSAFAAAPPQLLSREATLLRIASVVFAGGPSLFEAKRNRHPNIHCFPSSVDLVHFGKATDPDLAHAALWTLPGPRLGFFGVVDERFEAALVGALAAARPHWQICIVGPVVKIDPATLPQAANIHYFPQQPYAALPSFLAGWDVCLLPFAKNESTRFISPTKTLEYLAAEKPVVATDIADVVRLYGEAVRVGTDTRSFIEACDAALAESAEQRESRLAVTRRLTSTTSWDATATQMETLLSEAEAEGLGAAARNYLESGQIVALPPARARQENASACLILGAGPTGLSAAWHFGRDCRLLERGSTVGGWCRSIEQDGFCFDHAGHIMFSNDEHVLSMYRLLLGDNLHWQDREAWVYSKGVHTRYPFQGSLYGLPPEVLKECLVGAIEARFGSLAANATRARLPHARVPEDCCGDGAAPGGDAAAAGAPVAAENFEQFIHRVWGAGVAKHFAVPYNEKLWKVPLAEMETSWLGGRVPLPNLVEMIEGALRPSPKPMGPNARFGYPLRGGFQALMNGFLPHLQGDLVLDANVVRVSPQARSVFLSDGRSYGYEQLVSTLPLPKLVEAIGNEAPREIHEAAAALRHVSVRCVNLGIGRERITDKHWIYYPEDTVFHRIFMQGNASPHCNPPGGFGLTCEISHTREHPLPVEGDALVRRCIDDCIRVGVIRADDEVRVANQVEMPYAYVVYDHARQRNVDLIRAWLLERDIHLAGRYSEWEYYNSDHAFLAGRRAAAAVKAALEQRNALIA